MAERITVDDCRLNDLPRIESDRKGNLTPIYNYEHIPFSISRVYYLYDVPAGVERGGHAHKELQQLIVSVSGSFDVVVKDGQSEKIFTLNRPFYGLYIPRLVWRELTNFSGGSICLVLASLPYDEKEYIRDYSEFLKYKDYNGYSIS